MIRYLIEKAVDVEAKDEEGKSARDVAMEGEWQDVVDIIDSR